MVRSDVVGRRIRVAQDKVRKGKEDLRSADPYHPALARALDAGPVVGMRHLLTIAAGSRSKSSPR
jgi:hypothetical protein